MKLLQNFYGDGIEVYTKEANASLKEILDLSVNDLIAKMQAKGSDVVCLRIHDDEDNKNLIVLSNNEILAKKMDIQFNAEDKNLKLFSDEIQSSKISDLIDQRYFENTKLINIEDNRFFSFHCTGRASDKVLEFIEMFVEEQAIDLQRKNKSIKY